MATHVRQQDSDGNNQFRLEFSCLFLSVVSIPAMAKDRFVNPYPGLQVSLEERKQLIDLVDAFVQEGFQKYEDFVMVDKRKLDDKRWKHVKSKDNQHVYAERSQKEPDRKSVTPVNQNENPESLPVVLSVGTLVGDLDDLMLGMLNPTVDMMRVKASYMHDVDGGAVLCPILEPTAEDPFRSLTIKWMTIDVPLQSANIVKARDFVYIEAMGFVQLMDGNRIGYQLFHSIDFPQTKPLPNVLRANFSYFSCYQQLEPNVIDMYGFSTIAPGGGVKRFFAVKVASEAHVAATKLVFCGQMKKLSWMLQRSAVSKRHSQVKCVMCDHKTTSGIRGAMRSSTCKLCYGRVCYSCKIRRRLTFIELDGRLVQRKISFCSKCIGEAIMSDAQEAARDEMAGYRNCKTFSTSSQSDTVDTMMFD